MGNRAPSGRAKRVIPSFTFTYVSASQGVSCIPEIVAHGAWHESGYRNPANAWIRERTPKSAAHVAFEPVFR